MWRFLKLSAVLAVVLWGFTTAKPNYDPCCTTSCFVPCKTNAVNSVSQHTYSQPGQTIPQPVQTYSQPVQTISQPVQTYSQPVHTYSHQVQTVSQPVQTYSPQVQTDSQPIETIYVQQQGSYQQQPIHNQPQHSHVVEPVIIIVTEDDDDKKNDTVTTPSKVKVCPFNEHERACNNFRATPSKACKVDTEAKDCSSEEKCCYDKCLDALVCKKAYIVK